MRGLRRIWFAVGTLSEQCALVLVRVIGTWTFAGLDLAVTILFPVLFSDWFISVETRFYDTIILMASMVIARQAARQAAHLARMVAVLEQSLRDQARRDAAHDVALRALQQELAAIRRGLSLPPERNSRRQRV